MEQCRLCLTVTDTIPVLNNTDLIGKIKECVSIEISPNENYSKQICEICLEKINNWYEFKIICMKSKIILESKKLTQVEFQNYESALDEECRSRRNSVIIKREDVHNFAELDEQVVNTQNLINSSELSETDAIIKKNELIDEDCDTKNNLIYLEEIPESRLYSCEFCNKNFEYYTDYLDHQNDHNGEAVFNCAKCKMIFLNKAELVQHEKGHKIACHICGTYVQKQSLRSHLNKHTDKFRCSYCTLTFTCGPLLKEHINAIHMKLKLHFCDVCGKDFATRSSLFLHLKTHSDERQYKCDKCQYAGRTSISLRIHMSKHENNICICEYCSKIFKSNRNLYDHLKRVHHSEKKHECGYCGMKFALRYLVEQHKRTHTGIHPYKCTKCPKTFARSDGLKEHMKTHNRTEMFICQVCSKNFLTARGIKRHNCTMLLKSK